jgi:hypothetical protein
VEADYCLGDLFPDQAQYLFTYFKYVDYFTVHAYFRANPEHVNTLRKHMRRGYIGACPP